MRIPVFVSCPTHLNKAQASSRAMILRELSRQALEPRALGRSDYPTELPLREVYVIAKHCSGGVILGFSQFESSASRLVSAPCPRNQGTAAHSIRRTVSLFLESSRSRYSLWNGNSATCLLRTWNLRWGLRQRRDGRIYPQDARAQDEPREPSSAD